MQVPGTVLTDLLTISEHAQFSPGAPHVLKNISGLLLRHTHTETYTHTHTRALPQVHSPAVKVNGYRASTAAHFYREHINVWHKQQTRFGTLFNLLLEYIILI